MSGMFKLMEGQIAVIVERGVYKEVEIATRNGGELYVKAKGGFIRLHADGSTSVGSKCRVDTLSIGGQRFYTDRYGKLCTCSGPERSLITDGLRF